MRLRRSLLLSFSLSLSFSAVAAGDGDLWMGPVAMVCMAKQPTFGKTPLGVELAKSPQFTQAVDAMKASGCLDKSTVSEGLCTALFEQDPKGKASSSLYQKYAGEISGLSAMFSCLSKATPPNAPSRP